VGESEKNTLRGYPKAGQAPIGLILISGFRREVDEICALLGYYAASCGNFLRTFWDNVSVPSSRVKKTFFLGHLDP
jgi:hypothetical protein